MCLRTRSKAAKDSTQPDLPAGGRGDYYQTSNINYHGGEAFPAPDTREAKPDYLESYQGARRYP